MRYIITAVLSFLLLYANSQSNFLTYDKAIEEAGSNNKNIILVFSGSDWCKPCIQLKNSIIENPIFAIYKEENLIHLELDFPYKRKNQLSKEQRIHNENLAERFNPKGSFPFIVLISDKGDVHGTIDYHSSMTAEMFVHQLKSIAL
jgi:thioredoxin-related protein